MTKPELQKGIERQAAQPGTGRTSSGNKPGELPNTGLPAGWLALLGLGATLLGLGIRRESGVSA